MALVSQMVATSYPAVLAEMKKNPANQWAENAFLRELEKQGAIKRKSLGSSIDVPLDYQRNPGATFLSSDLAPVSMTKTEVITHATYDIAEISVPGTWSKKDEAMNPTENQKVDLVASINSNSITSHDEMIEQYVFATSTNGFLGFGTHIVSTGQGSDAGIDSATYTFWRNQQSTYVDDTDIESAMTTVWNACAKGSGSSLSPTWAVSDGATQALFEGTQQAQQRYVDDQDLKAGFKTLAFKTARYVFSQFGGTSIYMGNPKNFYIVGSKEKFREQGDVQEIQNANGYHFNLYSALQAVTGNRSRLGIVHL